MTFVEGLGRNLNAFDLLPNLPGKTLACTPVPLQSDVHSVHTYPYVAVVEKRDVPVRMLEAPAHGSEWTWRVRREKSDIGNTSSEHRASEFTIS
jgi:hypothetical protein